MKEFLDKDFLLTNETSKILYHEHAKKMPIYDYHCHLPVKEIWEDRKYESITDLWLVDNGAGDHYKWRAMRINGVEEKYITGDATKKEKFMKWAETIPYTLGNPLYHWTHLELQRYFGINELLGPDTAEEIYDKMNEVLKHTSVRKLIENSNVDTICTTDDPIDDLRYHKLLKEDKSFKVHVYPSFRPDKILNISLPTWREYVNKFNEVVGYKIETIQDLEKALLSRVEYFDEVGCRVADHSLEVVMYEKTTEEEVNEIFKKALRGEKLSLSEEAKYRSFVLIYLGKQYHRLGWVSQLHLKAFRNNSSRMFKAIGPDTGFDSINDGAFASKLSGILDELDSTNELPKTIAYSLNPTDNELLATMIFSFAQGGTAGKMQLGSGWWFNDQKDGMEKQLTALSNLGLLTRFVGMLTDSRSFLSYTRNEYFRRVLCNFIGTLVENGEYPNDMKFLGKVVEDICFNNAKAFFDKKGN